MNRTELTSPSKMPQQSQTIDDLYAYEPDRESPERLRVMNSSHDRPPAGYLAQTREREEREQDPRRQVSVTTLTEAAGKVHPA